MSSGKTGYKSLFKNPPENSKRSHLLKKIPEKAQPTDSGSGFLRNGDFGDTTEDADSFEDVEKDGNSRAYLHLEETSFATLAEA